MFRISLYKKTSSFTVFTIVASYHRLICDVRTLKAIVYADYPIKSIMKLMMAQSCYITIISGDDGLITPVQCVVRYTFALKMGGCGSSK